MACRGTASIARVRATSRPDSIRTTSSSRSPPISSGVHLARAGFRMPDGVNQRRGAGGVVAGQEQRRGTSGVGRPASDPAAGPWPAEPRSASTVNSLPGISTGRRRPPASGSPGRVRTNRTDRTDPSAPSKATGATCVSKGMPSRSISSSSPGRDAHVGRRAAVVDPHPFRAEAQAPRGRNRSR